MNSFPVRINKELVDRIREYVKGTGQTIVGYINVALDERISQDEKKKKNKPPK